MEQEDLAKRGEDVDYRGCRFEVEAEVTVLIRFIANGYRCSNVYLHPLNRYHNLLAQFRVTDREKLTVGETGTVEMELYGPCVNPLLHVGATFEAREGGRVIAEGTITAIYGVQPN